MTYDDLILDCEFWTNLGVGVISGDATLKAQFTRLINIRYARTLAKFQLLSTKGGAEDTNYGDQQFSTFNIEEGANSYQFLTDEDGNTIQDITGIMLQPESSSDYAPLKRLSLSDENALLVISPNSTQTGTPTGYIEKNNIVFFDVLPDYDKTGGGKVFYRLVPSYFVAGDTTKAPGFVEAYHRLLSMGAAWDWLLVNKPEATALITRVERELNDMTTEAADYIRQKNPTRARITGAVHSSR
jgi:hypothetical protein